MEGLTQSTALNLGNFQLRKQYNAVVQSSGTVKELLLSEVICPPTGETSATKPAGKSSSYYNKAQTALFPISHLLTNSALSPSYLVNKG